MSQKNVRDWSNHEPNGNSEHPQERRQTGEKTLTGQRHNSENTTCQSVLTRKSLIGSKARDAQLEFQREEYPRAGGKQESIRTPQTLLSAINLTYCITGLSLRIGASKKRNKTARMIKARDCLNVYNVVLNRASKLNTYKEQFGFFFFLEILLCQQLGDNQQAVSSATEPES